MSAGRTTSGCGRSWTRRPKYSRLVVIRGDALTGTSRTVYEAVTDVLADWALEHPPTAAELAARLEAGIPPRTVLWLGELRHYADADGGAAVLAHLNDLLDDDGRVMPSPPSGPGTGTATPPRQRPGSAPPNRPRWSGGCWPGSTYSPSTI